MDLNKQKEQFSIAFIRVLAAVAGVYVQEHGTILKAKT